MWFEALSRLRINMEKSEMIPIGDVARVLRCKWVLS